MVDPFKQEYTDMANRIDRKRDDEKRLGKACEQAEAEREALRAEKLKAENRKIHATVLDVLGDASDWQSRTRSAERELEKLKTKLAEERTLRETREAELLDLQTVDMDSEHDRFTRREAEAELAELKAELAALKVEAETRAEKEDRK